MKGVELPQYYNEIKSPVLIGLRLVFFPTSISAISEILNTYYQNSPTTPVVSIYKNDSAFLKCQTSFVDSLSWLIKHYVSVIDILMKCREPNK